MAKKSKESSIHQVKQKYEMQLLSIEGVEGVGIQEDKGKEVLVVYTSEKTETLEQKVEEICDKEDCPVKLEQTGEFRAS